MTTDNNTENEPSREQAIAGLMDELAELVPSSESVDTEPEMETEGRPLDMLVDGPISLKHFNFADNILSPTPGDPYNLKIKGKNYFESANYYMLKKFRRKAQLAGLNPRVQDEINQEIELQHVLQCQKNTVAVERARKVLDHNPAMLTDEIREIFYAVRAGMATPMQAILFLETFPEAEAIDVLMDTVALDRGEYEFARDSLMKSFAQLQDDENSDIAVIPTASGKRKRIDVTHTAAPAIDVKKVVRADIYRKNAPDAPVIELLTRCNSYAFPAEAEVDFVKAGLRKHPYVTTKGETVATVDLLPISISGYIRIKTDRSSALDTGDMFFRTADHYGSPVELRDLR
jgi:hypothetical protein